MGKEKYGNLRGNYFAIFSKKILRKQVERNWEKKKEDYKHMLFMLSNFCE